MNFNLLRLVFFGTIWGVFSDIIGVEFYHAWNYLYWPWYLIPGIPYWMLYWVIMWYALPQRPKYLRFLYPGLFAIVADILTVKAGILWYTVSPKYTLCLGIPIAELGWLISFPIIYGISITLYDWLLSQTKNNIIAILVFVETLILTILMSFFLVSAYMIPVLQGWL